MLSDHFFEKVNTYADLSEARRRVWQARLREEYFVELAEIPTKVDF